MQSKTLLVTELLGDWNSQSVGDEDSSRIFRSSYEDAFQEALNRFRGVYLRSDDPSALVFDAPVDAVRFALDHHKNLQSIARNLNLDISPRVGLNGLDRKISKGTPTSPSVEVEEFERNVEPIAQWIKSLALPGQTLLTGSVFDDILVESQEGDFPPELVWLEHGVYRIEGLADLIRVIEVGLPGLSPLKAPEDTEQVKLAPSRSLSRTLLGHSRKLDLTKKVRTVRLDKPAAPTQKYGDYEVIRELGKGGFGTVYLAENSLSPGMKFALKVFKGSAEGGDQTTSLLSDLRPMLLLAHPHIVKICGFGSSKIQGEIQVWMAMTYVEGPTGDSFDLKKYLKSKGKLHPQEVKRIFSEILSALVHVHESFFAHLDLKPQNVLLNKSYRAFLADFGISKSVSEDSLRTERVHSIEALSPEYASPEQLFEHTGTRHSDVFSAGVMMLECLTGKRPKEVIELIRYGSETKVQFKLPSSFGVDPSWDRLIGRCLKPNPVDRYKDATALLEALGNVKAGDEKKLALSLSGVFASFIVLAAGYYFYRGTPPPESPPKPLPSGVSGSELIGGTSPDPFPALVSNGPVPATPTIATPALPTLNSTPEPIPSSLVLSTTVEPSWTPGFLPAPSDTPTPVHPTPANTATDTMLPTWTASQMPTSTYTASLTPTQIPSMTPMPTNTPSKTPPPTDTPSMTPMPTNTPSMTPMPTDTPSMTPMPTNTPSMTPMPTDTPSMTPMPTNTPSQTPSLTFTETSTPTATETPTVTPSKTPVAPMVPAESPPKTANPPTDEQTLQLARTIADSFFQDINQGRIPKSFDSGSQDPNLSLNRLLRQTKNSRGEPQILTVREIKLTDYGSIRVGFTKDPARKARISGKPTVEWCELFVKPTDQPGVFTVVRVTLD